MRIFRLVLILGIGVFSLHISAQEAAPAEDGFYIKPHLNNITPTGCTIIWECPGERSIGEVQYGEKGSFTETAREAAENKIHKVRLENLKPDTTYSYKVVAGNTTHENQFITAPGAPRPITFVTLGDTRRWGGNLEETEMAKHFMQWKPEFIINNGDLVMNGHMYQQWPEHFMRFGPISEHMMVITARGNHEGSMIFDADNDWFNKYHEMPGDGEPYASFTWGNTHFVLVSYEQTPGAGKFLEKHMPAVDSQYTITAQHFPMYCAGYFGPANDRKEYGATQTEYAEAIDKFNIDMHLSGHTHIYERLHQIRGGKRDRTGCAYAVNGGDIDGQYPDWFTVISDNKEIYEQPTYTVIHMGDDRIWARTFAWNKINSIVEEIDYYVIWKDEVVPKAEFAKLATAKGDDLINVITELGAMSYLPAAPELIKYLDSADEKLRHTAAKAIKLIGSFDVTASLLPSLQNADIAMRQEIARAIEISMNPDAAKDVAKEALNTQQNGLVRARLAAALQFHGDKIIAHDTLLSIVRDATAPEETRQRASYWLINVCDDKDVPALADLFKAETHTYVLQRLAWTLGTICGIQQNIDEKGDIVKSAPGDARQEFVDKWVKWLEKKQAKEVKKEAA